jgi:hypothetical protein
MFCPNALLKGLPGMSETAPVVLLIAPPKKPSASKSMIA